jgi:hypothetical protein
VPHQVLVGVAKQVVALSSRATEVEVIEDGDELGEAVLHLLALAELLLVVEVGLVDDVAQPVGFGELGDVLIDRSPISLSPLSGEHVIEGTASRYIDQTIWIRLGFVGDKLHKQKRQDVVLVLTSVHATTKLVAACPERCVKIRLLQSHRWSS